MIETAFVYIQEINGWASYYRKPQKWTIFYYQKKAILHLINFSLSSNDQELYLITKQRPLGYRSRRERFPAGHASERHSRDTVVAVLRLTNGCINRAGSAIISVAFMMRFCLCFHLFPCGFSLKYGMNRLANEHPAIWVNITVYISLLGNNFPCRT